jgi:hypothetical protein
MADKPISELVEATKINQPDSFVLEQDGMAKRLTGQALLSFLLDNINGHGSIIGISKINTNGLVDTYSISMADGTHVDFSVTNGNGIVKVEKTATSGLVDTYTIQYSNGNTDTITVTNGKKGDTGDNAYVWIKYASQQPSAESHSFGDVPDAWIGIANGTMSSAPTDWKDYKWYRIRGEKGEQGDPPQHKWDGTTLIITSASGTSSADLRGLRGIPGKIQSINGYEPDPMTGDLVLGAGHKITTPYMLHMDIPVTFATSLALVNGLGHAQIVSGYLYRVTWRTTEYECRAHLYGGSVVLGNDGLYGGTDTGEPFVFEVAAEDSSWCYLIKATTNREAINVKVEQLEEAEYIPIPKEYIPKDIYDRLAALEAKVGI